MNVLAWHFIGETLRDGRPGCMTTTAITWHRVADKLPDDRRSVLLFFGNPSLKHQKVMMGWYDGDSGIWFDVQAETCEMEWEPTHWAEMPEGPK